jgi:hypothetical protein
MPPKRKRFERRPVRPTASSVTREGPMKEIGIVTLLSVLAVAAAPHGRSDKVTVFVTNKSAQAFDDCFAAAYFGKPTDFVLSDRGSHREIQLRDAAIDGPQARGVKLCL